MKALALLEVSIVQHPLVLIITYGLGIRLCTDEDRALNSSDPKIVVASTPSKCGLQWEWNTSGTDVKYFNLSFQKKIGFLLNASLDHH